MTVPRTSQDFDAWFEQHGGDPWGYDNPVIAKRLLDSVGFIGKHVLPLKDMSFVEFGAFDGRFTELLHRMYPHAQLYVNDISGAALERARQRLGKDAIGVTFFSGDLLNTELPVIKGASPVLLLLECLYYLPPGERRLAIRRLRTAFPESRILISAPITGGKYFTEDQLIALFQDEGCFLRDFRPLTLARGFPFTRRALLLLTRFSSHLRSYCANQVIYLFEPNRELHDYSN